LSILNDFERFEHRVIISGKSAKVFYANTVFKLIDFSRELEVRNRKLMSMLGKHEWSAGDYGSECPECSRTRNSGHYPWCGLNKLIGGDE